MTNPCDTDGADRIAIDAGLGEDPTLDASATQLVEEDGEGAIWSLRCDGDVHTAISRGLAEYMSSIRSDSSGRIITLNRVTIDFPDTGAEQVDYPVAAILGDQGEGVYEMAPRENKLITQATPAQRAALTPGFTPMVQQPVVFTEPGSAERFYLLETATYRFDRLTLMVRCGSKEERTRVVKAIEDASSPYSEGMGSLRLRLLHYYGAVARYHLMVQSRADQMADAVNDTWVAIFRYRAECPTIRAQRLMRTDPQTLTSLA